MHVHKTLALAKKKKSQDKVKENEKVFFQAIFLFPQLNEK